MCRSSRGVHSCGSSPAASTTFRKERRTCEASAGVPTREGNTRSFSCHHVERITPPEAIATRLGLDPRADTCVVRRHVRYIDDKPAIISDDYFDERIVRGTELAEPEDTTRENILAEAGYEQVYDIDEIITRMPGPAEIAKLAIPTGTPVAEHIRTGYTASGKPVRVMISIIPGDTLVLEYTIPT